MRHRKKASALAVPPVVLINHERLNLAPYNPNEMTPKEREALRASILKHGLVENFVVQKRSRKYGLDLVLVGGHQRLGEVRAIRAEEGIHEQLDVPCVVLDIDDDQAMQLNVALNKIGGTANEQKLAELFAMTAPTMSANDVLASGYTQVQIDNLVRLTLPPAPDDADSIPEPPRDPVTKLGDVWQLGEHRLVCGDCRESSVWNMLLGDEKAQMVWTDPPYNVGIVGGFREDSKGKRLRSGKKIIANDDSSPADFRAFLKESLSATFARVIPGGAVYVTAPSRSFFYEFAVVLGRDGLDVWRQMLVWVKNSLVLGHADYHYRHEVIFYGWVPGSGHYFTTDRTNDSIFEIDRPSASKEHPTVKPTELVATHIRNSSKKGWLVVDPFGGSGTTLIACEQEKRRAAIIEINPGYCDVIIERWQRVTGGKAERIRAVA